MAETMEAIRYSDSVTIRAHAGTNSFVQAKARELGSKPAEITRQALLAGLKSLGFDPATASPPRDTGGGETQTLVTANLPPYTPAGSVSVLTTRTDVNYGGSADNFQTIAGTDGRLFIQTGQLASTGTLTGTAQGGSSTAFGIVQPTIILNKILRII